MSGFLVHSPLNGVPDSHVEHHCQLFYAQMYAMSNTVIISAFACSKTGLPAIFEHELKAC